MRTFIAVPLSPECHKILQRMQDHLRPSKAEVRWTSVQSIHLTLKFLGEIDPQMLPSLTDALRGAASSHHPFALRLHTLGCFPNLHSPRVVWCGVEGAVAELANLQEAVEKACVELNFPPEERAFRPHLTLGRVQGKRNLQRLSDCIKIGFEVACEFSVDRFNIYRSTLTPRGAIYEVLEGIAL